MLVRHGLGGLGGLVRHLGLPNMLARAGHVLHLQHAGERARLPPPQPVRRALEELGPAFVKFGQMLAGRSDLLGPEWIAEFGRLHSRVPSVPLERLRPPRRRTGPRWPTTPRWW